MNRSLGIAFLGLSFVVGSFVRAEAQGGSGATGKVGYVDLQRTLNETQAGKSAKKKLEADKAKKQKELDRKQQELQQYAAELDKQRLVLKPDVLRQRERELQEKYVKLQETYLQLQQGLVAQEAELVKQILLKATPVIKEIAAKRGYSMIVDKNAVLWASDALDITNEVNQRVK